VYVTGDLAAYLAVQTVCGLQALEENSPAAAHY
jgi:hypothetical protein